MSSAEATGAARAMGMDTLPGGFGRALLAAAAERDDVVAVTADLARYTELTAFAERHPERLVNVGMAEQNLVAVAGGLAMAGLHPVVTTFAAFLTRRAQDFVVMQVALPRRRVLLVGGVPGICPTFGPSHTSIDDVATMRALPHMVVLDPCDAIEQEQATRAALDHDGPVYMRKLRGREPLVLDRHPHEFRIGRAATLRRGGDVAIFASSIMVAEAVTAADRLDAEGVDATVVNVSTLKPLDAETVLEHAERTAAVVTAENHSVHGGLFGAVCETLAAVGVGAPVVSVGIRDEFPHFGSMGYPQRRHGLTADDVVAAARRAMERRDDRSGR